MITAIEKQESNALLSEDAPIHGWYRFVLSYPPHLVRKYAERFKLTRRDLLCDPFCGTGTTLVEAKKHGIPSVGCESHPFSAMVSRVKTTWDLDVDLLRRRARQIVRQAGADMQARGLPPLSLELLAGDQKPVYGKMSGKIESLSDLIPTGFLSERPLHRLLILKEAIQNATRRDVEEVVEFFNVALAHVIANGAGNFAFGPEIYRTRAKPDYDVLGHFAGRLDGMIADLQRYGVLRCASTPATVFGDDARTISRLPDGISAVITSPPYPNEKDYTRTTRVESVLLGIIDDKKSLRHIKHGLLRSNTRNVFVSDSDADEVREFASIRDLCYQIEQRRLSLGKTSGFERLYHKVVAHYFGGMRKHLRSLKSRLRSKASLAYVVGDQYSFLMVPVRTAALLAEVAEAEGYRVKGIDLWRERIGTKVRNSGDARKTIRVREEVLLLENP